MAIYDYISGAELESFFSLTLSHFDLRVSLSSVQSYNFLKKCLIFDASISFCFFIQGTLHFREWIRHIKHPDWLLICFQSLISVSWYKISYYNGFIGKKENSWSFNLTFLFSLQEFSIALISWRAWNMWKIPKKLQLCATIKKHGFLPFRNLCRGLFSIMCLMQRLVPVLWPTVGGQKEDWCP